MNQRKDINEKYNKAMTVTRSHMNIISRIWSRFIHFAPVELLLNLIDRTIFRPIPLLSAGIAAFFGGLGIYSISLYNGYSMSGSEIPLLLIGGLFVGIIFDYLKIFFSGNA